MDHVVQMPGQHGRQPPQPQPHELDDYALVVEGLFRLYGLIIAPIQFAFYERVHSQLILHILDVPMFLVLLFFVGWEFSLDYTRKKAAGKGPFIGWLVLQIANAMASFPFTWIGKPLRYFLIFRAYHIHGLARIVSRLGRYIPHEAQSACIAIRILFVHTLSTHTVGCIFYFLATIESVPGDTWLGSLKLGESDYSNFRERGFWEVYNICFYFAGATLTTVGYGDIHPVNWKEMLFGTIIFGANGCFMGYVSGLFELLVQPQLPNPNPHPHA